ncbi:DNA mismatch repair protein MLH1 [Nematocida displodere]|uniref:DNA mismatch repair protein MLH1 n=1 Tax=Nematocida displodere TaxID=1805483 RepID=A0A177EIW7_9MICR|nr:DNA mismatch repair protein MLH1 [Nematocida displodere]
MGIEQLPAEVIERIAAGEVVVSPSAAVKEMLENSLDSGCTTIRLTLTENLIDLIEIEDNGCGVKEKDLPLLCQRFATSKLSQYQDLSRLTTLGFRGEALSSISMLSEVTVLTSTTEGLGHLARYKETRLVSQKEHSSGRGTRISVANLFHNDPVKREAFRDNKQEIKKIVGLFMKYSVAYTNVLFEITRDRSTLRYNTFSPTKEEAIAQTFTPRLRNELTPLHIQTGEFSCHLYLTHPNISLSSPISVTFVNRRLVELPRIKRALTALYREVLVKGHPFLYLEVEVDPSAIDVNVHPSKTEVYLGAEEDIIRDLEAKVRGFLQSERMISTSRGGRIGSDWAPERSPPRTPMPRGLHSTPTPRKPEHSPHPETPKTPNPSKRVRTDSQVLPLNLFMSPRSKAPIQPLTLTQPQPPTLAQPQPQPEPQLPTLAQPQPQPKPQTTCLFIGLVSERWCLVQKDLALCLVNLYPLLHQYLVQVLPSNTSTFEVNYLLPKGVYEKVGNMPHLVSELAKYGIVMAENTIKTFPFPRLRVIDREMPTDELDLEEFFTELTQALSQAQALSTLARTLSIHYLKKGGYLVFKELQMNEGFLLSETPVTLSSTSELYQLFGR